MKILITGGAGYIGSVVTESFLDRGYRVVVVDDLSTGHLDALDSRVEFHRGDLSDREFIAPILEEGIEAVCHFAAFSLVGESVKNPLKYYRNNVVGAYVLLRAMKDTGVGNFLFSSTAAVYGEPSSTTITEDARLRPVNAYGNTKLAIEKMLWDCSRGWDLGYISLRYFNAAGASSLHGEDHRPETHLIPIVLEKAMGQRDELIVYGNDYPTADGTCIRDYIHVKDLATAHVLGLEAMMEGYHGALNLGNGTGFSVLDVIEAAEEVTGVDIDYVMGNRREGDPAVLVASSRRAEEILGWERTYPDIVDIIRDAYNWKKQFPQGYEK